MTINEMFDELENKVRDTYIVTLKYKYDFEENYTIENQILMYDSVDDSYVWLNDWNEGQTDVEVLGYMLLGDVDTTKLLSCEDCISRQDTIDAIYKKHIGGKDAVENAPINDLYACGLEEAVDAVENMPPVTPQPKVGEWVVKGYDYKCKNCEAEINGEINYMSKSKIKYCPYCGIKLEGEQDK